MTQNQKDSQDSTGGRPVMHKEGRTVPTNLSIPADLRSKAEAKVAQRKKGSLSQVVTAFLRRWVK